MVIIVVKRLFLFFMLSETKLDELRKKLDVEVVNSKTISSIEDVSKLIYELTIS